MSICGYIGIRWKQGWLRGGGGIKKTSSLSPPPPQCCRLSWSNPDWVGHILTELDHQKWPTLIFCLIKEFELVKPQHWPTRVGHTSTLTDLSWSNLNIDWLELVKPQHWPTRVGQTSTLIDSSWSNLNIDQLELVKPQHWPTRVGQTSTSTNASCSNLLLPLESSLGESKPSLLLATLVGIPLLTLSIILPDIWNNNVLCWIYLVLRCGRPFSVVQSAQKMLESDRQPMDHQLGNLRPEVKRSTFSKTVL